MNESIAAFTGRWALRLLKKRYLPRRLHPLLLGCSRNDVEDIGRLGFAHGQREAGAREDGRNGGEWLI